MNRKHMTLVAALFTILIPWAPLTADSAKNTANANDPVSAPTDSLSAQQIEQVNSLIKNYLLKNPEILIEAGQILQQKQAQAEKEAAMTAIKNNKEALFNQKTSPVLGNPKGSNIIVEFYDYQCGHCKDMNATIMELLSANTNTKLILKELPIFGDNSEYAAKASLAVYQIAPQSFDEFHKQLLEIDGPASKEKILAIATQLKIDPAKLKQAMSSPAIDQELKNNFKIAKQIGIQGTPSFVLANGKLTKFTFVPGATSKDNLLKLFSQLQ